MRENTLLNPALQDKDRLLQRIQIPVVVNFAKKMWICVAKTRFSFSEGIGVFNTD